MAEKLRAQEDDKLFKFFLMLLPAMIDLYYIRHSFVQTCYILVVDVLLVLRHALYMLFVDIYSWQMQSFKFFLSTFITRWRPPFNQSYIRTIFLLRNIFSTFNSLALISLFMRIGAFILKNAFCSLLTSGKKPKKLFSWFLNRL